MIIHGTELRDRILRVMNDAKNNSAHFVSSVEKIVSEMQPSSRKTELEKKLVVLRQRQTEGKVSDLDVLALMGISGN